MVAAHNAKFGFALFKNKLCAADFPFLGHPLNLLPAEVADPIKNRELAALELNQMTHWLVVLP